MITEQGVKVISKRYVNRVNVEEVVVGGAVEVVEHPPHEGRLRIHREEEGQSNGLALPSGGEGMTRL